MSDKHTLEELNNCSREELITIVLMMQGQLDALNENIERLIEQVRLANSYRFGKHTETLKSIDSQISFFDEAEALFDAAIEEPSAEDVLPKKRTTKKKGQRELDLKEFPEEIIPPYSVSEEELDKFYGKRNWRRMPDETFKRLRHEPESWTVEIHTVEVYVGTEGEHQDGFMCGKRPKKLLRNSIVTPSLLSSILNVKYVNSSDLYRVEQEFERNGVNISRQTMSNWIIRCSDKYFVPFVERMKQKLLSLPVTQADETPLQVLKEPGKTPQSKSYIWLARTGEDGLPPIILYHYSPTRSGENAVNILNGMNPGYYFMADGYNGYNKVKDGKRCVCFAHLRRYFLDAVPKGKESDFTLPAVQAVLYCNKLFEFERRYREKRVQLQKAL